MSSPCNQTLVSWRSTSVDQRRRWKKGAHVPRISEKTARTSSMIALNDSEDSKSLSKLRQGGPAGPWGVKVTWMSIG